MKIKKPQLRNWLWFFFSIDLPYHCAFLDHTVYLLKNNYFEKIYDLLIIPLVFNEYRIYAIRKPKHR